MAYRGGRAAGFTYVSLIIMVAIIGLVAAATLKMGSVLRRNAAEQALLDIGAEFGNALQSYAKMTPPGQPPQPPSLNELLRDPRFPGIRRHLRKIYIDPITGKAEWGIVFAGGDKGVLAVYSLSQAKPIKQGNFEERFQGFEGREHLSDWKFAMPGQSVAQAPPVSVKPPLDEPAQQP